MRRRSPSLALNMPRCRNCNRYWQPAEGVSATKAYCFRCALERRSEASLALDLKPLPAGAALGLYLLPRALRGT
jgi:hypothetical protein